MTSQEKYYLKGLLILIIGLLIGILFIKAPNYLGISEGLQIFLGCLYGFAVVALSIYNFVKAH